VRPRIYAVANNWEFDQLIDATIGDTSYRLIKPGQEVELPLLTQAKDGMPMDAEDRWALILLYWRKTSSMRCPRLPLCLLVKTSDVVRLSGAEP
jgi:hypothetical protein